MVKLYQTLILKKCHSILLNEKILILLTLCIYLSIVIELLYNTSCTLTITVLHERNLGQKMIVDQQHITFDKFFLHIQKNTFRGVFLFLGNEFILSLQEKLVFYF